MEGEKEEGGVVGRRESERKEKREGEGDKTGKRKGGRGREVIKGRERGGREG